ncbi:FimB/Mfa2 family fimbrial subunit [Parabacteroides bouchesdurhonensis]|uniref:FimB/Mfa2 family fimbrial subunit n=1 Tax=Parabacteroides bouchesdurhonensis TaxID=1936995 RepID=UPI00131C406A|nr:FimB/Mfa2 family fimbrial subunit [Parabacteroides bouchesdurhonensis]
MKKLLILLLFIPVFIGSCSKDDDSDTGHGKLIIPQFGTANLVSKNPFTGILIIAPAEGEGAVYYGNYNAKGQISPVHALYTVSNGSIVHDNIPVRLPAGQYNLVYWGMPKNNPADSTYSDVAVIEPVYIVGNDMNNMFYGLRKHSVPDTTYYPSFDYVYCLQPTDIGKDQLNASLQRATAGIKVTLTDKDGGQINENIAFVRILVGNIANTLNYFTGKATDFTKTVSFPLTKSEDGKEMSANSTVMVFPSAPNPSITLILTLLDGKEKIYRQSLQNTLDAGTRLTLTASIGDIFVEETGSNGFEVTNWNEKSETINFGDN